MGKILTAEEVGLPILEAFGIEDTRGVQSMMLLVEAGKLPILYVKRYVRAESAEEVARKFKVIGQRYSLVLKDEEIKV